VIGKRIAHYRIEAKLGEGGMGEIYCAEDTKLGRRVALKVLPTDPERKARFEREAKAVAALNHPNIVTIHSVEESDGIHFIIMELVKGRTLAQMLPKQGFSLGKLLEIAIPLAGAVSSAHRAGISHRDLKPDNIMIDTEGRLRVLDFGLAKVHDPDSLESQATQAPTAIVKTGEGRILGTVAYMSPEQAEGKAIDQRTDVFSLGTILFEMATGERPFRGDTSMSTIGAILRDDPAPVTDYDRTLPRHLARIIRRCLAKDPERRYQTAFDLRNELEGLKVEIDSGVLVGSASVPPPARRKALPFVLVIVSVLAVAVLGVAIWQSLRDRPVTTYTSRPITASKGQEADINWSPESEFVAFGQIRKGSFDVMVQPVAGGEAVVRASGPGSETSPCWSPDGKYLAYVSSSETGSHVFLVPPHGGEPRRLIDTNIRTLNLDQLQAAMGDHPWAPDSRTLLVARADGSGRSAIYRVHRDDGEAEQITFPPAGSSDLSPSFSFDGEKIVFKRNRNGKGGLMTMPASGGEPKVLLVDQWDNIEPAWRPDNRNILFISDRAGNGGADVWQIDSTNGFLQQLTFETNRVVSVSVSADDRIAYTPFWHYTFLYSVEVVTGETQQLTSHSMDNFGARYSPNGRSVAYHSTRTGNSEIWIHHLDGRPETRITDNGSWDLYPDWSPDGERLLFVSDRDGSRFKIYIVNRDGGGERLLLDQPVSLDSQISPVIGSLVSRWSPDGDLIAVLIEGENTRALWTFRPNGEDLKQVLTAATDFDWYLDNRRGIYARHYGSETELVAVNLESGEERSLFIGPLIEIDVAPDGSAVSFCLGRGHMAMGLAVLKLKEPTDADGLPSALGEPELVVPTEGTWHVHNGGWSADSKRLVYTQDEDYGDIFELVERR
jgi:serine/threonine protein kinase/Tol biopolymer transport system component